MCVSLHIHFTYCETRRAVILNERDKTEVYDPFENPPACDHRGLALDGTECEAHGDCCNLDMRLLCFSDRIKCQGWQIYHAVVAPHDRERYLQDLYPYKPFERIRESISPPSHHGQLRILVFTFGALIWQICDERISILERLKAAQQAGDEVGFEFWEDKLQENYDQFNSATANKSTLAGIWDEFAEMGIMETCPLDGLAMHPWGKVFQRCPTLQVENEPQESPLSRIDELRGGLQGPNPMAMLGPLSLVRLSPSMAASELCNLEDVKREILALKRRTSELLYAPGHMRDIQKKILALDERVTDLEFDAGIDQAEDSEMGFQDLRLNAYERTHQIQDDVGPSIAVSPINHVAALQPSPWPVDQPIIPSTPPIPTYDIQPLEWTD